MGGFGTEMRFVSSARSPFSHPNLSLTQHSSTVFFRLHKIYTQATAALQPLNTSLVTLMGTSWCCTMRCAMSGMHYTIYTTYWLLVERTSAPCAAYGHLHSFLLQFPALSWPLQPANNKEFGVPDLWKLGGDVNQWKGSFLAFQLIGPFECLW